MKKSAKKLYLLDMDGTLYLGNHLFEYTKDFLSAIKEQGGRYLFLTNNSSKGVEAYIEKLKAMGIESTKEDYLSSVDAAIAKLHYNKIYLVGTKSLEKQLKNAGMNIVTSIEEDIDCLLIGFDTELNYSKILDACTLLRRGIPYYATNPDWVCPVEDGFIPDCGSMCEMLEHATGRKPIIIGKPQPDMIYLAMKKCSVSPHETVVIGDRVYTDIASGINAKVDSYLVLSGEGTVEDIEKYGFKPTKIFANVGEIL